MRISPTTKLATVVTTIASAVPLALTTLALGAGGGYTVDQCDAVSGLNAEHADASYSGGGHWLPWGVCGDQAHDYALNIHNQSGATTKGQGATWTWYAPPGEAIIAATFAASLRNDSGVHAHVYFANSSGIQTKNIATGDAAGGWQDYGSGFVAGQARLVARALLLAGATAR